MNAAGSIAAVIFGIIWTVFAINLTKDAPFPFVGIAFPLFGVLFVVIGIVQAVYHFKNATGRRRMSLLDIVEDGEEPDPLNERFGGNDRHESEYGAGMSGSLGTQSSFCPYCGNKVKAEFEFCPNCGKKLSGNEWRP